MHDHDHYHLHHLHHHHHHLQTPAAAVLALQDAGGVVTDASLQRLPGLPPSVDFSQLIGRPYKKLKIRNF